MRDRQRERERAERAAFHGAGGVCFYCRDRGACDDCGRGRRVRDEQRAAAIRERRVAMLKDIPPRCQQFSLDTYPYPRLPAYRAVRSFLASWDEHRGCMLMGTYGTGKTGLLVAMLREIASGWADANSTHRLRFLTGSDLMAFLRAGYNDDTRDRYEQRLAQLRTVRLLAIDDLGAERPTDWVQEQFFTIVNYRYEHLLPIFATTNYGLQELAERLGERVLERLMDCCQPIDFKGTPNLRLRGRETS